MSRLFSLATRMGRAPFVALPLAGDCPWGFLAEGDPSVPSVPSVILSEVEGPLARRQPSYLPQQPSYSPLPVQCRELFMAAKPLTKIASGRRARRTPSPVRGRGSTAGGPFPRRAHGLHRGSLELGDRGETLGRAPTTDRCLRQRTATSALPLREGGRRGATLPVHGRKMVVAPGSRHERGGDVPDSP